MSCPSLQTFRELAERIIAAAAKATPAPWIIVRGADYGMKGAEATEIWGIDAGDKTIVHTDSGYYPPGEEDTQFIVLAREGAVELAVALLASLDALEKETTRAEYLDGVLKDASERLARLAVIGVNESRR